MAPYITLRSCSVFTTSKVASLRHYWQNNALKKEVYVRWCLTAICEEINQFGLLEHTHTFSLSLCLVTVVIR